MQVQAAAANRAYLYQVMDKSTNSTDTTGLLSQQSALKTDTVEISELGKLTTSLLESMMPSGSFQEQVKVDQAWLQDKIKEIVGEDAGNYTLEIDADGHVNVTGEDEAKARELEQAFEDDFELHNRLTRLSANSSIVRAATEHEKFARAYAQNPQAAVAQYSYLFDGTNNAEVSFEYGDNGLNVMFDSVHMGREYLDDYLNASE